MNRNARSFLFVVVALALFVLGCHGSSDFMQPTTPQAIAPQADAATVVFIRPSGYAGAIVATIVDEHGRFLGDAEAERYFAVRVAPGEHLFTSWTEGTNSLKATLAPGRVYFVEVAPKMGAWSARVALHALTPRSPSWGKLPEWLRESKPQIPNEAAGQARMAERAEDLQETLQKGAQTYREYEPDEIAERTINPDDGVATAVDVGGGGIAPPPGGAVVPLPAPGAPAPGAPGAALGPGMPGAPAGAVPGAPGAPAAPGAVPPAAAPPPGAPPPAAAAPPAKPASPPGSPDQVFLKNGGRVRGKIMEDEPVGVSILLPDGSVKKVVRADIDRVEYAH